MGNIDNDLDYNHFTCKNLILLMFKKYIRNVVFNLYSRIVLKKTFTFILISTDNTHQRELFPLYKEFRKSGYKCLLITNKPYIFKEYFSKSSIIFVENRQWKDEILKIIKCLKPRVLICANDLLSNQQYANEMAKKHGIKTFCLQHGAMSCLSKQLIKSNSDFWCVFGSFAKVLLFNSGLDKDRIFITGSNYLFNFINRSENNPKIFLDNFCIVLLSGYGHMISYENYKMQLESLHNLISKNSEINFLIKLHPKESLIDYSAFSFANCKILAHKDYMKNELDLLEYIHQANSVIASFSSTVYEALALGKVVFTIDCKSEFKYAEMIDKKVTIHSTSSRELEVNYSSYLNNRLAYSGLRKNADKFINEYFYLGKKSPAAIQASAIIKLL